VDSDEEVLISGGGDGTIKLWRLSADGHEDEDGETTDGDIQEILVLGEDDAESVISLAVDGSFLYAGKLHGVIELWDMDTKQRLRVIKAHTGDVMTLQMSWGLLWSAAAGGSACVSRAEILAWAWTRGMLTMAANRNTVQFIMAVTATVCRKMSARSTSASAGGRRMKARFLPQP
jgi:WD40 repeat protein